MGIVAADTELYRHFADGALVPGLAQTWRAVFMAQPMTWGLALAAGEATLGLLLLSRSRRVRAVGWSGVIAFQLALMAFGWGFWLWSVPALALVVPAARSDVGTSSRRRCNANHGDPKSAGRAELKCQNPRQAAGWST